MDGRRRGGEQGEKCFWSVRYSIFANKCPRAAASLAAPCTHRSAQLPSCSTSQAQPPQDKTHSAVRVLASDGKAGDSSGVEDPLAVAVALSDSKAEAHQDRPWSPCTHSHQHHPGPRRVQLDERRKRTADRTIPAPRPIDDLTIAFDTQRSVWRR